jgi:hypothetical protein
MHWELMQKLPGPFEHCQESVEHWVSQPVRFSQLDPELLAPDPLPLPEVPPELELPELEPAEPELPVSPELPVPELPVPLLPFDTPPEELVEPPVAPSWPQATSHAPQTPVE